MPHATCFGSPVALMEPHLVAEMRAGVISEMADVNGAGFQGRQVRLAIPAEALLSPEVHAYKPVLHVGFAFKRDRSDDVLREVCKAGAAVLYRYFAPFGVEEVQFTWEVDEADRFDRFPAKS